MACFFKTEALDKKLGNYESKSEFTWKTVSQGTATHFFAAFETNLENGIYCLDVRAGKPEEIRNNANDKEQAERLWKLSEEIVGQTFE
jgi:hypothetical protein